MPRYLRAATANRLHPTPSLCIPHAPPPSKRMLLLPAPRGLSTPAQRGSAPSQGGPHEGQTAHSDQRQRTSAIGSGPSVSMTSRAMPRCVSATRVFGPTLPELAASPAAAAAPCRGCKHTASGRYSSVGACPVRAGALQCPAPPPASISHLQTHLLWRRRQALLQELHSQLVGHRVDRHVVHHFLQAEANPEAFAALAAFPPPVAPRGLQRAGTAAMPQRAESTSDRIGCHVVGGITRVRHRASPPPGPPAAPQTRRAGGPRGPPPRLPRQKRGEARVRV